MPVSMTKNNKDEQTIRKMFAKAFPEDEIVSIAELTEGFFNVAYKIESKKNSTILKIAPACDTIIMTHEKNIMFSEVDSMRMTAEKTDIPVAKILYYDDSHTVCDSDYFFMNVLEGKSFVTQMDMLTQEQRDGINKEIGIYTKKLNSITNDKFGYYCQTDKQGKDWYTVFKSMIGDTYYDAARKMIPIPISEDEMYELLEKDKEKFMEVEIPCFVHWDLWAGNIFVNDGKITGLIDFERCMWADPLLEVGFRTYGYDPNFFEGYGIDKLTENQQRRATWYDIYLFLISCLECDYRNYDNRGSYDWGSSMLKAHVEKLV